MYKYKAILFDLDDTLIDNDESIKFAIFAIYKIMGISSNEETFNMWKQFDNNYWHEWESGNMTLPNWASSLEKRIDYLRSNRFIRFFKGYDLSYEEALKLNNMYTKLLSKNIIPIDSSEEVISQLSRKYELIISTNGDKDAAFDKVKAANIYPYIDKIISSCECGFSKPMPGFFDYAISKMNTKDRSQMLIVGDSLTTDILGGIDNGIDCCWFNPHHKENTLGMEPTYEIDHLTQLIKKL